MTETPFLEAASLDEGPHRVAALAEWVQSLASNDESKPVLVGGGAVELYTGGAYRTGDLDFVGSAGKEMARQLEQAGFRRKGRHWVHEQQKIFLEFPSSELGTGETSAVIQVGPYAVVVIGLEELVIDRLAAWEFWKSEIDGINAYLLVRISESDLDKTRLRRMAAAGGGASSLERLERFILQQGQREPVAGELENWARAAGDET